MAGESVNIVLDILGTPGTVARVVADNWVKWDTDRKPWKDRVSDVTNNIYAESTRDTENGANFEHSTHRPKLTQIYDNLTANYVSGLMPHKKWLRIENETSKSYDNKEQRVKILAYLVTKHRLSGFAEVIWDLVDDWVLYGNAFAMVYYVAEKTNEDNTAAAYEENYKGPRVRRISPLDIVFNPLASSFAKSPKIVRSLKSMAELIREAEDNPEDGWKMDVVRELQERRLQLSAVKSEDIDKSKQMVIDGFGSFSEYITSDVVEILELYGDIYDPDTMTLHRDQVVTVADRHYTVRQEALKNWTGRPHIHHSGWRKRKDNLWAMGPLDNLLGMQFRINHLENARADAFDEMIHGDLVMSADTQVEEDENGVKTYLIGEGGSVHRLTPDTTVLNADLQIATTEAAMELYAGSPREAAGFRTPGEKTKFEVSLLATAASRIFQHKMSLFEVQMMEPIVNSEIMVAYNAVNTTEEVRSDDDPDGIPEFVNVTKGDLLLDGKVVPIGARHFARQAQLVGDLNSFSGILQADEALKQHFSSEKMAELWESALGIEEYKVFESYVRIDELAEANRKLAVVQSQAQAEAGAGGEDDLGDEGLQP